MTRVGDRRTGRRRRRARDNWRGRHAGSTSQTREIPRADRRSRSPPTAGAAIRSVPRSTSSRRAGCCRAPRPSSAADVFVFPVAPPQSTAIPKTELLDRLGTHLTRHIGPGVEYADIRPYVPGDQLRTVNWPVSARRGSLHVTAAVDRPGRRCGGADRYVRPAAGRRDRSDRAGAARSGSGGAERTAQRRPRRDRHPRRRSAALARRRHRPAGSSTGCSTRCWGPATNSKPRPAHWRPAPRCRRVRSSSRSPRCSTPSSRCR